MSLKITVNNQDVKNPVARFLIALVGVVIVIVAVAVICFLLIPLIWFVVISVLLVTLMLLVVLPRFLIGYRVIVLNRKSLGRNK